MAAPQHTRSNTKEDLRESARQLFARHGYEGVSMRDIAGSVGIRQSAIYNHFSSKQDLLVDLMVSHMEHLLETMRAAIKPMTTPTGKLRKFAWFHVTYHIEYPRQVFLAYMELRSLEAEGKKTILPLRDAYERTLRDILIEGQKTGDFAPADPPVLSRGILAMLTGVTVWYRDNGRLDRETVANLYADTVLRSAGVANLDQC